MKTFILVLTLALCLMSCCPQQDENSITQLREYEINGIHIVVGVGEWQDDGTFRIQSYNGKPWISGKDAEVLEGPVSLESFQRITE